MPSTLFPIGHRAPVGVVVVLATGGTIAGRADSPVGATYQAAQIEIGDLVAGLPPLQALAQAGRLEAEQVAQIDSKDMSFAVWRSLVLRVTHHLGRKEVCGVVVTHGTDTLEETAYLLSRLVAARKPVVLTAAMRPSNALDADGPRNLLDAVAWAFGPGPGDAESLDGAGGVVVAMASQIWAGHEVRKAHSWRIDAFDAGDASPLVQIHPDGGLLRRREPIALPVVQLGLEELPEVSAEWPWVEIVVSAAGVAGRAVDALVAAGVQGLVVAATGGGTVHRDLQLALDRAQAAGVRVLICSRVARGGVSLASGGRMEWTPAQARVELMLRLLATAPAAQASGASEPAG